MRSNRACTRDGSAKLGANTASRNSTSQASRLNFAWTIALRRDSQCLSRDSPGGGRPDRGALHLQVVLDGEAPIIHDFTLVESRLLAAHAHATLGDQRAATASVEGALARAEADRLIFPFVMTASRELLEAIPRHATAHAALLIDILDVMRGSSIGPRDHPVAPPVQDLTEMELRVLRFLPTNLSRREIARELYLSVHTVNTHVRNIYTKLDAGDRSTAIKRARELRLLSSATSR